jgi:hypothetical protein
VRRGAKILTFKPGTMTDEAAALMYAQLAIEEMP